MDDRGGVVQTVVQGTLGTPPVFAGLLLVIAMLMGFSVALMITIIHQQGSTATELRLVQQQLIDTNAILLRRGYIQPGDLNVPAGGGSPR